MRLRRTLVSAVVAGALVVSIAGPAAAVGAAVQCGRSPGADGVAFDSNWYDFDIVEAAAFAVLGAKPISPVGLLGSDAAALTVLAPNDRAFRVFAYSLTGKWSTTEAGVVKSILGAITSLKMDPINTLETVLLYHVLPGRKTSTDVLGQRDPVGPVRYAGARRHSMSPPGS